jgi:hypothetical protein
MNNEKTITKNITDIPLRISRLPTLRGFPVPWFVAQIDGQYDFRVVDASKFKPAIEKHLCWICGQRLGTMLAFTIGPMCAINRTISEPPSHRECAEFSIKFCPFLNQTQTKRRETNLPEDVQEPAGVGLKRQPGAVLLWLTKTYRPFKVGSGLLFEIGKPEQHFWFREGRTATREEVLESINSGLPLLREAAERDGKAGQNELERRISLVMDTMLPDNGE